jgi:hypothetical protein
MTANLTDRLRQAIDGRLRVARAQRATAPAPMSDDDHERQRARVLASVLLSRRQDRGSAGETR